MHAIVLFLAIGVPPQAPAPPQAPPVREELPVTPTTGLRWVAFSDGDTNQIMLVDAQGRQVGVWMYSDRRYHPLAGRTFGAAVAPPIPPPAVPVRRLMRYQEGAVYAACGPRG